MTMMIRAIINGKKVKVRPGQTILQAARENGIEIPALCYHSDLDAKSNCRLCLVEIKGVKNLQTACSTEIKKGMEIKTETPEITRARKINLELIFSQHFEECDDCVWGFNCRLLELARKYKVKIGRFLDRKSDFPVYQFGPSIVFDTSKCVDCRNCFEICRKQGVNFLKLTGRGWKTKVVPSGQLNEDCIYCGQCIVHCPAGAVEAVGEFEDAREYLSQFQSQNQNKKNRKISGGKNILFDYFGWKNKIVVAQFAPAIRTSVGEKFGMAPGFLITEKLTAGIKELGFDKVFDVCVGADFTTIEEADELIMRWRSRKKMPMFTSCCPAWVKFVEFYAPDFIPYLTTVRSPHIISGGLIKTFWAKKQGINPKDIIVVSIMPCVAKKYEITRSELKINGLKPVDCVLTTRELIYFLTKCKIDLKRIKGRKLDSPLGSPSGAGVIYGASGGVMESALRTAYEGIISRQAARQLINERQKKNLLKIEFKRIGVGREFGEIREAKIKVGKKFLKIAVINGIGPAKKVLEKLRKNPRLYDYVEVMTCPGGCIGGGGQPVPTTAEIRNKRAIGLYQLDKKKKIRQAQQNPIIKEVYQDFFAEEKTRHKICHTGYSKKKKGIIKILPSGQH